MGWTDERVATLKRLFTDGKSASQIALALGDVTRNGVIGKIHRLGLSGRPMPPKPEPKPKPVRLPKVPKAARRAPRSRSIIKVGDPGVAPEPVYRLGLRITLMMLTEHTCRWPIGHPGAEGFTFCGQYAQTGIAYCAEHMRIAHQSRNRDGDKA